MTAQGIQAVVTGLSIISHLLLMGEFGFFNVINYAFIFVKQNFTSQLFFCLHFSPNCQTPVLGLGLGVDFTFAMEQ